MFVRVNTDIMVGNKTIMKGHTTEATKSEGRDLVTKGYAEEVDALDTADAGGADSNTEKWQTVIAINDDESVVTVNDMTGPELKKFLTDNEVDFKSSAKVNELKDLVEDLIKLKNEG